MNLYHFLFGFQLEKRFGTTPCATAEPPCSTTVTPSAPPYKTAMQHHGNALHHPKAPQQCPEFPGRTLDTPE